MYALKKVASCRFHFLTKFCIKCRTFESSYLFVKLNVDYILISKKMSLSKVLTSLGNLPGLITDYNLPQLQL